MAILIVDAELRVRQSLAALLQQDGHSVVEADNAASALAILRSVGCDAIVADVHLEDPASGFELLADAACRCPAVPVILFSRFATVPEAVKAMRLGAFEYLETPVDPERLCGAVHRALEHRPAAAATASSSRGVVIAAPEMQQLLAHLLRAARVDVTTLIVGETGTGKEVLARLLHEHSSRRLQPFVPINCAAIPESLVESELFGHEKGAFTGAVASRRGVIEEAARGTLFLDEVAEMSLGSQARLLRFLDDGEVRRVGDPKARHVDVRIVAATNRDLQEAVAAGRFRKDLLYRLNVVTLKVPPLRKRSGDIPTLAAHFAQSAAAKFHLRAAAVGPDAVEVLMCHDWPGNVRELRHVIEAACIAAGGDAITAADVARVLSEQVPAVSADDERRRVVAALALHSGNCTRAAEYLGISRTTLWRKLRRFGITPADRPLRDVVQ